MAVRQRQPRQQTNAAVTAALVLAGLIAAPVLAATDRNLDCDTRSCATPGVAKTALALKSVSNSDEMLRNHLLKPRTEAAVRGAFADDEQQDEPERDAVNPADDEAVAADPGVQSAPKAKRGAYKRQMYRRDI